MDMDIQKKSEVEKRKRGMDERTEIGIGMERWKYLDVYLHVAA